MTQKTENKVRLYDALTDEMTHEILDLTSDFEPTGFFLKIKGEITDEISDEIVREFKKTYSGTELEDGYVVSYEIKDLKTGHSSRFGSFQISHTDEA